MTAVRPTVALAMMVRDEAHILGRCLSAVRPLIDTWVVVDTGSVDGTPQRVTDLLAGIPGTLYERPWRSFGENRTELLALARGSADFLMLLDADLEVEVHGDLHAALPLADCHLVPVRNRQDSFRYWMRYLVRGDLAWRYEGRTHEFITADVAVTSRQTDALVLVDHADGGGRPQKFVRDEALLRQDLAEDPGNARARFYLAQTLRNLGRPQEALVEFRRRVELGGWDEEVYYCWYSIGEILEPVDWPGAVDAFLRAIDARPGRAEPLQQLSAGMRSRHRWASAALFAAQGLGRAEPEDLLFVDTWVYRWGMLFEYSISSWYVGDRAGSLRACDALLARDDLPPGIREQVVANRRFSTT